MIQISALRKVLRIPPKRLRVLFGLANGKTNKEVALDMGIAETTVWQHRNLLYRTLGKCSTADFARLASAVGLTDPNEFNP